MTTAADAMIEGFAGQKLGRPVRLLNRQSGIGLTSLKEIGLIGEVMSFQTPDGFVDVWVPFDFDREAKAA